MTRLAFRTNGRPGFTNVLENFLENEFPTYFNQDKNGASANVKETKDAYVIEVTAPGFQKDSFNVKIEDTFLTISGEAKEEKLEEGETFTRQEFVRSSFKRSFTLPKTVLADKISAGYENGILTVTLPKMEEAKKNGSIEVKVS